MIAERSIFSGMKILIEDNWVEGEAVVVEGPNIKAIIPENMIQHHLPAKHHRFNSDCYLVPGFIDLHIHGAKGSDIMDGDLEAFATISKVLAAEGVTSFLPTTMTASKEQIEKVLALIPEAMTLSDGARVLGVHLEGPFIAAKKMGAQLQGHEVVPNADLFAHWQAISHAAIKIVTLAPELPGALQFIKDLHRQGIVASVGHTDATYEETNAAIIAGCTYATHLFNAMSGLHQRKPGAACALLLSNEVTAELIVDGIHLHPAIIDLSWVVKHKDLIVLVTDAMRGKCLKNGTYELGGQEVLVHDGKATLANGVLAGSTLRMTDAIKNMVAFTKCSLVDAIKMASTNPARILGLGFQKGSIAVGKDADLVVLDPDFKVLHTLTAGKMTHQA